MSKIIIPSPKTVNAPVPPAKPSIPSVRLIALLSQTNTKTDKNQNNIPASKIILPGNIISFIVII